MTSQSTNPRKDNHVPICKCALCGGPKSWEWEEAFFYNDGFDDGINSQTEEVETVLADAGYEVTTNDSHAARYIDSIKNRDGIEQIVPHTWRGEADPRGFLPDHIVKLLDAATFGETPAVTVTAIGSATGRNEDLIEKAEEHEPPAGSLRIIAEFLPQVWVRDFAMTVDPLGPTTFDVTEAVLAMGELRARALRDDQHETDHLRDLPTAPAWVTEWPGPFSIHVEASIDAYFKARNTE
jgi:hypothetical protein